MKVLMIIWLMSQQGYAQIIETDSMKECRAAAQQLKEDHPHEISDIKCVKEGN